MVEPLDRQTILVVDDTPDNIDILISILKSVYKVMVATSGTQAIQIVRTKRVPDLILLDIIMPGIDGYETCRQLKHDEGSQDIDIIFVSAKDDLDSIIKGYEAGGSDYLTKPVQPQEVMQKVKLALQNKKNHAKVKKDKKKAMETAVAAVSNTGEQGIVLDFLRNSFKVKNVDHLSRLLIDSTSMFHLKSSVQFRTVKKIIESSSDEPTSPLESIERLSKFFTGSTSIKSSTKYRMVDEVINCTSNEPMSPLEQELLFRVRDAGPILEDDEYYIVNHAAITLLIKNMPENSAQRDRLRNHLEIILEGAMARLDALELEEILKETMDDSQNE